MATELLLPTSVIASTNLNASIGDLDEGIDNADGVWATATGGNGNTLLTLGFPTPSGQLTLGTQLQSCRFRIRKNATGGNTTTFRFEFGQNGTAIAATANVTVTTLTGLDYTVTWDAGILPQQDGSNFELTMAQQAGGQGGNPNNRRWLEVDTSDWTADYIEGGGGGGTYSFSTFF